MVKKMRKELAKLYVGCWDCHKPFLGREKSVNRPRGPKKGWSSTVSVCKDCRKKWLDKHTEFKKKKRGMV